MDRPRDTLTPEEAAAYLRLNAQTVYRLLRDGQLPGVKVGRQWRIRRAALEQYLDGGGPPRGDGQARPPAPPPAPR